MKKIGFKEAKRIIDEKPQAMLIDVREEEEYITGHAVGAELFILDDINRRSAAELIPDKATPILVYCRTGRRSRVAAQLLESFGYSEVYDIGGLIGWPYGME